MNGEPGSYSPANDEEPVDALLRAWARRREIDVPPGAALAAANAALAEARSAPLTRRRWFPAAVFGGSVAAALTGVLLVGPDGGPSPQAGAGSALEIAAASEASPAAADDGLPRMASDAQLAAIAEEMPALDGPTDDLLMTSHVFTTRPDEELIY